MSFDEQLRQAFDTLTDRLRDDIARQVRSVMDELAEAARAERDRAADEARGAADQAARSAADVPGGGIVPTRVVSCKPNRA